MNKGINEIIKGFKAENISSDRKVTLHSLVNYLKEKSEKNETVRLNFICTHNSRRSHLSQIWAQTMAHYFNIKNVHCYSGGTEATAMFPKIAETLQKQGFDVYPLSEAPNPVYAVKFNQDEHPLVCFSKAYFHPFNPTANYAAVVTCNSADEACPVVVGAESRFPIKYDDPKAFDHTDVMDEKYAERSLQIGEEMWYIFKNVFTNE